jgi:hypothetical protein
LDRSAEVLYVTLLDSTNTAVMVAVDLPHQRVTPVPPEFTANNTGPYCFDASLRMLISVGSPAGGIVGLEVRLV